MGDDKGRSIEYPVGKEKREIGVVAIMDTVKTKISHRSRRLMDVAIPV